MPPLCSQRPERETESQTGHAEEPGSDPGSHILSLCSPPPTPQGPAPISRESREQHGQ